LTELLPAEPKHVYLIDGSGFIFRAFHALPPLNRADGTPVNAVLGFSNMLLKCIDETDADHIAVIFDASRLTFRNRLYEAYKAQRPEPPPELIPQFKLVREATEAFNVAQVEMSDYEADDLIATYARLAVERGATVTIVSSDKDLMQLVGPGVTMYDPLKQRTIGADEVREKFGVGPEKVIDVQALCGDSVDNVPGVPGISAETAGQLISRYDGLEALLELAEVPEGFKEAAIAEAKPIEARIYEIAGEAFSIGSPKKLGSVLFEKLGLKVSQKSDKISVNAEVLNTLARDGHEIASLVIKWRLLNRIVSSIADKLHDYAAQARVSRALVELKSDVPPPCPLSQLALRKPDHEKLLAFLKEQNFRQLLNRIQTRQLRTERIVRAPGEVSPPPPPPPATPNKPNQHYELVQDEATLDRWIAAAHAAGIIGFDTETTSLDAVAAELVGLSIATGPGRACYIPVGHAALVEGQLDLAQIERPKQIPLDLVLAKLKPLLEDPAVLKVGHNLKYDIQVLTSYGIALAPCDCTMLIDFVLDAGLHGMGLDELALLFLDHETIKFKDVAGSGKTFKGFAAVALDAARDYAAEDADICLRLYNLLKPKLIAARQLAFYETVERPLMPIIADMERAGIKVDRDELRRLSVDFGQRMGELEKQIHALAGESFNVASPKQLGEILFDKLSLPGGKKGKTGAYGTDAALLEQLALTHDLPRRVLDWRQLAKLKSTYADALIEQINPKTGRVHTSYSLVGAATGRLASTDPNLQNIPIRTEEGRKIRRAFVAEPGNLLLSADYSQIELRLAAHVADIPVLKEAFRAGLDIHAMTASEVFGVPIEGMDKEIRRRAKAINFGIIYGISAFGLAQQLSIPTGEAADYIKAYFARFPGIRDYMERTKAFCREHGYVTTIFGRKCHLPGIRDSNPARRAFSERAAINAPLQGAAADIIKRAMIRLPQRLAAEGFKARMLLQVHDELVFEVPEDEAPRVSPVIKDVMETALAPVVTLSVPLVVETGWAKSWEEAH
jgi:DNA polymerase-1